MHDNDQGGQFPRFPMRFPRLKERGAPLDLPNTFHRVCLAPDAVESCSKAAGEQGGDGEPERGMICEGGALADGGWIDYICVGEDVYTISPLV